MRRVTSALFDTVAVSLLAVPAFFGAFILGDMLAMNHTWWMPAGFFAVYACLIPAWLSLRRGVRAFLRKGSRQRR